MLILCGMQGRPLNEKRVDRQKAKREDKDKKSNSGKKKPPKKKKQNHDKVSYSEFRIASMFSPQGCRLSVIPHSNPCCTSTQVTLSEKGMLNQSIPPMTFEDISQCHHEYEYYYYYYHHGTVLSFTYCMFFPLPFFFFFLPFSSLRTPQITKTKRTHPKDHERNNPAEKNPNHQSLDRDRFHSGGNRRFPRGD